MIRNEPIGLFNTGLPVALLVLATIAVPRMLIRPQTQRHDQVWSAIAITVITLLIFGTILFAITYAFRGHGVGKALLENPLGTVWFFGRLSGMAAIIWLPILALVWLVMAQRVEHNRGEHAARMRPNETSD